MFTEFYEILLRHNYTIVQLNTVELDQLDDHLILVYIDGVYFKWQKNFII